MPRLYHAVAVTLVIMFIVPLLVAPGVVAANGVELVFTRLDDDPTVRLGDSVVLEARAEIRSAGEATGVEMVRFIAQDDTGRFLVVTPSRANLTPASPNVTVRVTYPAQSLGERVVRLEAIGAVSRAEIKLGVEVLKDVARVAITDVAGPDSQWSVDLAFETVLERVASATGRVEVVARYSGDAGEFEWTDDAWDMRAPGVGTIPFRLRFGAGSYALVMRFTSARADGVSEEVRVNAASAADANASIAVHAVIADAPAELALTTDSVNAFRAKSPGDAIITRFTVADENGLDDVASLRVRYERADGGEAWRYVSESIVDVGVRDWSETSAAFEDRFARSPLPVGAYRARVIATSRANESVEVDRTFNITDARPTATVAAFEPARLGPGHGGRVSTVVALADRNFGTTQEDAPAPAAFTALEARLYRASTRVPWPVALGPRAANGSVILDLSDHLAANGSFSYRVENGAGVLAIPVEVSVPPGASEGAYRVSVYELPTDGDARLLGSANFDVGALPTILRLVTDSPVVRVNHLANVTADVSSGDGVANVTLRALVDGAEIARATYAPFNATARINYSVALPDGVPVGPLTLTLEVAPVGGGASVERSLSVVVANEAPRVTQTVSVFGRPVHGTARVIPDATLEIVAQGTDSNRDPVTLALSIVDWNGVRVNASLATVGTIDPPMGQSGVTAAWRVGLLAPLPAGRYTLVTTARDIHGGTSEASTPLDVGAWLEIGLVGPPMRLEDAGDALAGSTTLENVGNAPLRNLHVRLDDGNGLFARGEVVIARGTEALITAPIVDGSARLVLDGTPLLAGETATLTVRAFKVPGLDAGVRDARLTVVAEASA